MNISRTSQFTLWRRALSASLLAAAAVAMLMALFPPRVLSSSRVAASNRVALAKIAPWVLDKTADGSDAEFLIVLADQADVSGADALVSKEEKGRYVYDVLWQKAQATQKPLLDQLRARGIEHRAYYIVNMIWVKGSRDLAFDLADRADVARIEGNPQIQNVPHPLPVTDEAESVSLIQIPTAVEAGITHTRAPLVWTDGFTGQGVVVGAADTGYRWTHAALKNKYRGWDGVNANHDYNWHDSIHSGGGTCGANSIQPCDDNGHGTHTAGTAVGDDGGTNQVGMAPGARWIGCRNMNQGNGTPATYIECMEFFLAPYPVAGTPAQGDPTKAPHVTNNSWGCPASEGCSASTLQQAVEAQQAAGILMVVSAGNSGSACSTVSSPPSFYEASYSVGALTTGTDTIASFSSRGPTTADGSMRRKPDIAAPGTSTRSSTRTSDTTYGSMSGTSMAGPHVAGAVALLLSARPALQRAPLNARTALNNGAFHINSATCDAGGPATWPNNVYGYGRLDVKTAVDNVVQVNSAVSRKNHGGIDYDIPLPLSGNLGVEPRNSGGSHTIVVTFDRPVTTGNATLMSGSGNVLAAVVGNTMTITLSNANNAQTVTLNLANVTDGAIAFLPPTTIRVGLLVGDTNGDGSVNTGDALQTRGRSGQGLNATNFRSDVTVDGAINSADTILVRSRAGTSL